MLLYFGTYGKLKKEVSTGIDYCPTCGKFTGFYVGRSVKRWHICYIPIFTKTLDYFHMCGICEHGSSVSQTDYFTLKEMHKPFSKRKEQIKFFEQAAELAKTMPANDLSVQTIVTQLSAQYPICATPRLEAEYRRRIGMLLQIHGQKDPSSDQAAFPQPGAVQVQPEPPKPREMDTI